jgi:ribosome recycling factor
MDQIKKGKADGLSEDDQKIWEDEVQDLTNRFIKQVDEMLETKQTEIMHV